MVVKLDVYSGHLGANVAGLRKKNGMTQAALAKKAGTTRASITLFESGSANPTLEQLLKVATALNVSVEELISRPKAECQLIKAADIPVANRSESGVKLRKLLPDSIHGTGMDELTLEAGATMVGSPHLHGTKEYFTCLKGKVSVRVLGTAYDLSPGDVVAFPGDANHSYKNVGKETAHGVSVVFIPTIKS